MGVTHFQSIYKEPNRQNIAEILKISSFYPSFVIEEENQLQMEIVSKEELKSLSKRTKA
jgi:hypothetical protein